MTFLLPEEAISAPPAIPNTIPDHILSLNILESYKRAIVQQERMIRKEYLSTQIDLLPGYGQFASQGNREAGDRCQVSEIN